MSKKRDIFVILGMHRSGTSAISRALKVFDIELGENLMPAYEGVNSKGFWEDLDIYSLNEEMLTKLDLRWDSLSSVTDKDIDYLVESGFLDKAIDLLEAKLAKSTSGKFGFKDPRVTRLFGFWHRVLNELDGNIYYIVATRSPLSISESLKKRDNMLLEKSLHLWLEYIRTPFKYIRKEEFDNLAFINYESLVENPINPIEHLSGRFDLIINSSELDYYVKSFISKDLKHHDASLDSKSALIPKHISTYSEMIEQEYNALDSLIDDSTTHPYRELYPLIELSDTYTKSVVKERDMFSVQYQEEKKRVDLLQSQITEMKESERLAKESERLAKENLERFRETKTYKLMNFLSRFKNR